MKLAILDRAMAASKPRPPGISEPSTSTPCWRPIERADAELGLLETRLPRVAPRLKPNWIRHVTGVRCRQ